MSKSSTINQVTKAILISGVIGFVAACGESTSSERGPQFGGGVTPTPQPTETPDPTPDPAPQPTEFDKTELISNIVDNVVATKIGELQTSVALLKTSVVAHCDAVSSTQQVDLGLETAAQEAFKTAFSSVQMLDMMQIGVISDNNAALRNTIYSWPNINTCSVDQDVIFHDLDSINGSAYDITKRPVSRRGMDALEYLLFTENLEHSCPIDSGVIAEWANKNDAERLSARCQFSVTVVDDVVNNAAIYAQAWQQYSTEIKNAGQPGNQYATTQDAVNAISDALFYIDSITKDDKLGTPLGFFANACGNAPCPQEVESNVSDISIQNIKDNVQAFISLFNGNGSDAENQVGFDDYLIDVGDQETSDLINQGLNNAITSADQISGSLDEAIISDKANVEALHADIKSVTDQMKTDFITSLSLELPATSAGDND